MAYADGMIAALLRPCLLAALLGPLIAAAAGPPSLAKQLSVLAPSADPVVLALALEARRCAQSKGLVRDSERLAVIDYDRPSTEPRLWVFNLEVPELLFAEHVAHGRGSGDNHARAFSNEEGTHQSSLGLFAAAETYQGANGYSLRLDGLEPGINDQARERAIVMHGAPYVDPLQALRQGRLGRSYGCPAVRPSVAKPLIDTLSDGQLVFAYHSDPQWQQQSALINCSPSKGSSQALRTRPTTSR